MTIIIRQIHPHFVGEVTGVDVREKLTRQDADAIEAGMDKYAVLIFRNQDITDEQQLAFARSFGEREDSRGGTVTKKEDYRLSSGLNDVSNLGKDGKPLPRDHRTHLFNLGNCLWHSDSSFRPIPAKFSLLSARVVNPKGGNTEFADMRAAYEALDDENKAEIEDLICEHSLMYSRGALGFLDYTEEEKQMFKPGIAAPRAQASGSRPQIALFVLACRRNSRHERTRSAAAIARSHGARDAAGVRLRPQVEAARSRDVGQSPNHAPRPPLRPVATPRYAPRYGGRHRADRGGAGSRIGRAKAYASNLVRQHAIGSGNRRPHSIAPLAESFPRTRFMRFVDDFWASS
jgi:hypothetical protein